MKLRNFTQDYLDNLNANRFLNQHTVSIQICTLHTSFIMYTTKYQVRNQFLESYDQHIPIIIRKRKQVLVKS